MDGVETINKNEYKENNDNETGFVDVLDSISKVAQGLADFSSTIANVFR